MGDLKRELYAWVDEADQAYDNPKTHVQEIFTREQYRAFHVAAELERWTQENGERKKASKLERA